MFEMTFFVFQFIDSSRPYTSFVVIDAAHDLLGNLVVDIWSGENVTDL